MGKTETVEKKKVVIIEPDWDRLEVELMDYHIGILEAVYKPKPREMIFKKLTRHKKITCLPHNSTTLLRYAVHDLNKEGLIVLHRNSCLILKPIKMKDFEGKIWGLVDSWKNSPLRKSWRAKKTKLLELIPLVLRVTGKCSIERLRNELKIQHKIHVNPIYLKSLLAELVQSKDIAEEVISDNLAKVKKGTKKKRKRICLFHVP